MENLETHTCNAYSWGIKRRHCFYYSHMFRMKALTKNRNPKRNNVLCIKCLLMFSKYQPSHPLLSLTFYSRTKLTKYRAAFWPCFNVLSNIIYRIPFVTEFKRIKIMSMKGNRLGGKERGMPVWTHFRCTVAGVHFRWTHKKQWNRKIHNPMSTELRKVKRREMNVFFRVTRNIG